jgi:miniconductance mechanosensitive channel
VTLAFLPPTPWIQTTVIAGAWLLLLGLVHLVARRILLRIVRAAISRTSAQWDDVLLVHQVPQRASLLVTLAVALAGLEVVPIGSPDAVTIALRVLMVTIIVVVARTLSASLSAINTLYERTPAATMRPIKSYLQLAKVIVYLFALVFSIAQLTGRSPWFWVSGLGAVMAIFLLIFRDTLLSLVAGIQLTNNDTLRVGDWIEMPGFGADGSVIDIALHTVKVQNWDRTITVIPTHKFLEHSFKNWRGMFEGGGRRIKRAVFINMTTIGFLSEAETARFERFDLLRDYIAGKRKALEAHNTALGPAAAHHVNTRRLTNIGTFRAYVDAYLKKHPMIRQDLPFLVRQLEPTPEGLPLEIYVFVADTRWAIYESTQADIFDHILAMAPEFGLRVYQRPSGQDVHATLREVA